MTDHLQQYVQYVRNAGGDAGLRTAAFDQDWEPAGPLIRKQLLAAGLTDEDRGWMIVLTQPGEEVPWPTFQIGAK